MFQQMAYVRGDSLSVINKPLQIAHSGMVWPIADHQSISQQKNFDLWPEKYRQIRFYLTAKSHHPQG